MSDYAQQLAAELNLSAKNVQGAIDLIDQGNTIPFIARYRKEVTGSMDDQVLRDLGDRLEYLRGLDKRKEEVTSSITEQGAMTPELTAALSKAKTLAEVEDLYRPYKPKRKTRASIAKARGLQPLADALLKQDAAFDPNAAAADYINEEVPDAAAALAGAKDIIAEAVSDDAACRAELRRYYRAFGRITSVKAKDEDSVYAQYYDYAEPLNKIPGHRVLALDRGEREGFLKVSIQVDAERAGGIVAWMFARKKTGGASAQLVEEAALDAYSRLIHPAWKTNCGVNFRTPLLRVPSMSLATTCASCCSSRPSAAKPSWVWTPATAWAARWPSSTPPARCWIPTWYTLCRSSSALTKQKRPSNRWFSKTALTVMAIGNGTAEPRDRGYLPPRCMPGTGPDENKSCTCSTWSSARQARRSTLPASWLPRSSLSTMSTCAARCLSPAVCRTRWRSWSRSTRRQSASGSTSTTCPKSGWTRRWTAWWRTVLTRWALT